MALCNGDTKVSARVHPAQPVPGGRCRPPGKRRPVLHRGGESWTGWNGTIGLAEQTRRSAPVAMLH